LREAIAERRRLAVAGIESRDDVTAQTTLESTPGMLRFQLSFPGVFTPESCTGGRAA
jgi:hypothetical protein